MIAEIQECYDAGPHPRTGEPRRGGWVKSPTDTNRYHFLESALVGASWSMELNGRQARCNVDAGEATRVEVLPQ